MEKCISFIDLLGTKATAIADSLRYREMLLSFKEILLGEAARVSEAYSEITKCRIFSDCAYLEFPNEKIAIDFYREVRNRLLLSSCIFQASLIHGSLEISDESPKFDDKPSREIRSILFLNEEAISAYTSQAIFKGIGINISEDIALSYPDDVIASCYVVGGLESNQLESYFDLRYSNEQVSSADDTQCLVLLKNMLKAYSITFYGNRRAARYYLAPMKSIIDSLAFDDLLIGVQEEDGLALHIGAIPKLVFGTQERYWLYSGNDYRAFHLIMINRIIDVTMERFAGGEGDIGVEDPDEMIADTLNRITDSSGGRFLLADNRDLNGIDSRIISEANKLRLLTLALKL